MSIPELFAAEGEEGFREVETQILAEVAAYKKCVVATGGGIVKKKANWMHLRNGVVVCLSGTPQLLASRVVKDGAEARPLFKDANGDETKIAAKIDELQSERLEMYANADVTVKLLAGEDGGEGGGHRRTEQARAFLLAAAHRGGRHEEAPAERAQAGRHRGHRDVEASSEYIECD